MAWGHVIESADGKRVGSFTVSNNHRFYELASGTRFLIWDSGAYCWNCHAFVECEMLPPAREITLRSIDIGPYGTVDIGNPSQCELKLLHEVRTWRDQRISPPRCLDCGSPELEKVPDDSNLFVHPESGETVVLKTECHLILFLPTTLLLFSPEGEYAKSDEVPYFRSSGS